eukprot:TRINITY_DN9315_c0_g1_i7.p1 TRINITY_DN9315_c0_g1~~TRINITY_DN9315_c0_g1_i7.p1  ORF type:complete len:289 (-),score=46.64 TRINITY_DN9315_c0_g1_i7:162-1028(-)
MKRPKIEELLENGSNSPQAEAVTFRPKLDWPSNDFIPEQKQSPNLLRTQEFPKPLSKPMLPVSSSPEKKKQPLVSASPAQASPLARTISLMRKPTAVKSKPLAQTPPVNLLEPMITSKPSSTIQLPTITQSKAPIQLSSAIQPVDKPQALHPEPIPSPIEESKNTNSLKDKLREKAKGLSITLPSASKDSAFQPPSKLSVNQPNSVIEIRTPSMTSALHHQWDRLMSRDENVMANSPLLFMNSGIDSKVGVPFFMLSSHERSEAGFFFNSAVNQNVNEPMEDLGQEKQ